MSDKGMQQEMLHREQPKQQTQAPQEQEVKQEPEKLKFGGGSGGGGKPFIRFGSSSSFSSVVCRPDPERPGHQICKKVVRESKLDPFTGERTERNVEKEEDGGRSSFFGLPGHIRGHSSEENTPVQPNQDSPADTVAGQLHDLVDRSRAAYDHGRSFFGRLNDLMNFGQTNNQVFEQYDEDEQHYDYNDQREEQFQDRRYPQVYAHHVPQHHQSQEAEFFDSFDRMEREMMDSFFGRGGSGGFGAPFGSSQHPIFEDPFNRPNGFHGGPSNSLNDRFASSLHRNLIDEIEREMFNQRSINREQFARSRYDSPAVDFNSHGPPSNNNVSINMRRQEDKPRVIKQQEAMQFDGAIYDV